MAGVSRSGGGRVGFRGTSSQVPRYYRGSAWGVEAATTAGGRDKEMNGPGGQPFTQLFTPLECGVNKRRECQHGTLSSRWGGQETEEANEDGDAEDEAANTKIALLVEGKGRLDFERSQASLTRLGIGSSKARSRVADVSDAVEQLAQAEVRGSKAKRRCAGSKSN